MILPDNLWLAGEAPEFSHDAVSSGDRPRDNENRVVSAHSSEDVGPAFTVQGSGDRLGTSGHRSQDQHFSDAVKAKKQLRQECIESGAAILNAAVGHRIACSIGSRDAGEPELAQIARQRRLGDVPAPLQEQFAEILLAAYNPRLDDLQNGVVPLTLVRHSLSLAPPATGREVRIRIIDDRRV